MLTKIISGIGNNKGLIVLEVSSEEIALRRYKYIKKYRRVELDDCVRYHAPSAEEFWIWHRNRNDNFKTIVRKSKYKS